MVRKGDTLTEGEKKALPSNHSMKLVKLQNSRTNPIRADKTLETDNICAEENTATCRENEAIKICVFGAIDL